MMLAQPHEAMMSCVLILAVLVALFFVAGVVLAIVGARKGRKGLLIAGLVMVLLVVLQVLLTVVAFLLELVI